MFVHSQVSPGVPVMREKRAVISYSFEVSPDGGRGRIKTEDRDARKAVHDFLSSRLKTTIPKTRLTRVSPFAYPEARHAPAKIATAAHDGTHKKTASR
jgi:hypothetical protein